MRFLTTISVNGKEKEAVCIGVEDGYQLKLPKNHTDKGTAVRVKLTLEGYTRQFYKEIGYVIGRKFEQGANKSWFIIDREGNDIEEVGTRKEAATKVRTDWLAQMVGQPAQSEGDLDLEKLGPPTTQEAEIEHEERDVSAVEAKLLGRATEHIANGDQVVAGPGEGEVQAAPVQPTRNPSPKSPMFEAIEDSGAFEKWLQEVPLAQTSLLEAFKAGARWSEARLKRNPKAG